MEFKYLAQARLCSCNRNCWYVQPLKSVNLTLALNLTKTQTSGLQPGNGHPLELRNMIPEYPMSKQVRRKWTKVADLVATVPLKKNYISQRPNPIDGSSAREQGECVSCVGYYCELKKYADAGLCMEKMRDWWQRGSNVSIFGRVTRWYSKDAGIAYPNGFLNWI